MSDSVRPLQRYKLTVAYRGTRYHGWQWQAVTKHYRGPTIGDGGIPTIQVILAKAITSVVLHPIQLAGSSRTDAGVHAKGQLAHFDTHHTQIPTERLPRPANQALPDDILLSKVEAGPPSFNVFTSTVSERYQ